MPKIKVPQTLDNIEKFEDFRRFSSLLMGQITDLVNGNIDIIDNLRINLISCSFANANTETQFSHNLGRIPSYYIPVNLSAAMTIYNGPTANTNGLIYLQSSAAGTASVIIF